MSNRYFSCIIFCAQTLDLKSLIKLSYVSAITRAVTNNDLAWINSKFITTEFRTYFDVERFVPKSYVDLFGTSKLVTTTSSLIPFFFTPTDHSSIETQMIALDKFFNKISKVRTIIYEYEDDTILTINTILNFSFDKLHTLCIDLNCYNDTRCETHTHLLEKHIPKLKKLVYKHPISRGGTSQLSISIHGARLEELYLDYDCHGYKFTNTTFTNLRILYMVCSRCHYMFDTFLNSFTLYLQDYVSNLSVLNLRNADFYYHSEHHFDKFLGCLVQLTNLEMFTMCYSRLRTLHIPIKDEPTTIKNAFSNLCQTLSQLPKLRVVDLDSSVFIVDLYCLHTIFRSIPHVEVIRLPLNNIAVIIDCELIKLLKKMVNLKVLVLDGIEFRFESSKIEEEFFSHLKSMSQLERFDIGQTNNQNNYICQNIFRKFFSDKSNNVHTTCPYKAFTSAYSYYLGNCTVHIIKNLVNKRTDDTTIERNKKKLRM